MLNHLFKRKTEQKPTEEYELTLFSPLSGTIIPITQVDDPVFAGCMVGDGLAIVPDGDCVISPVSGTITTLLPSGHAVGMTTPEGLEILVHVGLDTVELKGEGFKALVRQGQKVDVGAPLIELELGILRKKARSMQTPIIITNMARVRNVIKADLGKIGLGDWIMKVQMECR